MFSSKERTISMRTESNISLSGQTAKSDSPISPAEFKDSSSLNEGADQKAEQRLKAVVAFLYGEPVEAVQAEYGICRSNLYKFRQRALEAMREGLKDKKRGPHQPHNRLTKEREQSIKAVCERQPTLSSYQVKEKLGEEASTSRTIQRVRQRLSLPRLNKRAAPSFKAHRFTEGEKQTIQQHVEEKMHLGRYRLAWDLQNKDELPISPSTTRRVKRAIIDEQNPKPAPAVWRFYERKHPHSLWHGDLFEKVTLTDEDRTAYQVTLLDDCSRAYVFCDLFREVD